MAKLEKQVYVGGFFSIHTEEQFNELLKTKKAFNLLKDLDYVEWWIEFYKGMRSLINSHVAENILDQFPQDIEYGIHAPIFTNLATTNQDMGDVVLEEYKYAIDFASKINARYVLIHAGSVPFFVDRNYALDLVVERFKKLCRYAKRKNCYVCVENVPNSPSLLQPLGTTLTEIKYLLESVPDLRFALDIGHLIYSGDPEIVIDDIHIERLRVLHIHDTDGVQDHIEIGKGLIQFASILPPILEAVSDELFINVEVVGLEEMRRSVKKIKKIIKN